MSVSALSLARGPSPGLSRPKWSGAVCMLLAVLCFTLLDAIAKRLLAGDVHPLQVVWGRYAFSVLPLLAIPFRSGWRRLATRRPGLQLARGLALIGATAAMFAGLRTLPLADAYALSYVSPILVAVISRYAFAERLNGWQLTALAMGLAGVAVVIRPAFTQAGGAIVFPLLMAISYATYQVLTRVARHADDATVCVFYASLVGAGLMTIAMPFVWRPMPPAHWMWFALMGCCGLVGHWLLAVAAHRAPPSLLAPLSYTQLVYAALIDLFMFGAIPDQWTLVGSAIILAGGVLLWRAATKA
jgi:drug/metabolite transporter (DMT)-like permease